MMGRWGVLLSVVFAVCSPSVWAQSNTKTSEASLPVVMANDNRTPAGQFENGVLNLRLELRQARWYPEDEKTGYRDIHAFAEPGKAPQISGPLIRVAQGTRVRATIHNLLPAAAKVYGLHRHPGDANEAIKLEAGETRTLEFLAGEPGTYLYWGATGDKMLDFREGVDKLRMGPDTTLSGAFVVDPAGAKADDRIFVITIWQKDVSTIATQIPTINGKSWPATERMSYHVGETARWRVINASFDPHAMHLHGFFFTVNGSGDGERYQTDAEDQRRKAVTEFIDAGHTFDVSWTPDRTGNWLFHCHMTFHMATVQELHPKKEQSAEVHPTGYSEHDPSASMGGLVLGITVLPGANEQVRVDARPAHKLQLVISDNPAKLPLYKVEVNDPLAPARKQDAEKDPPSLMGPPIVITRGEPTEIEVKNQTSGPTVMHWHGIELESYYDGVAGWTGSGTQVTPPVAPGGSFVARMAPPRAGTFIYHTHWHDSAQLLNGVYGPLIVLEPGQKYDPEHDKAFVFSVGQYPPLGALVLINGSPQPDLVQLQGGVRYRLRFVNITNDAADLKVKLVSKDTTVSWKVIARDGADLPPAQLKTSSDELLVPVGGTSDVEYEPDHAGFVEMQVSSELFESRIMQPIEIVPKKDVVASK